MFLMKYVGGPDVCMCVYIYKQICVHILIYMCIYKYTPVSIYLSPSQVKQR
jgi:hypothetical protein